MSKFARFMKKNKILKENTTYAPTKSLLDENGEPVKVYYKTFIYAGRRRYKRCLYD